MTVTTVFFDAGGTLIFSTRPPQDIWLGAVRTQGVAVDRAAFEVAHRATTEEMREDLYDHIGRMDRFWPQFDGAILERLNVPDPDGTIAQAVYQAFRDTRTVDVFPDSKPALEELRDAGYGLGVISNADEEVVAILERLGLAGFFDHITFSQEARSEKPDAGIFRLALKRHRCAPEEAVHVGDLREADVVGARGVGISPVLIDRKDAHPDADCPRVRTLLDLEGLLAPDAKS